MSFHQQRYVKIKKDHTCSGCCHIIPKDSNALKIVGKTSYDFYSGYLCIECDKFLNDHPDYFDCGEWYEGDIGSARQEESK